MRKSHQRPRNEEDFELLCLKLLRVHWTCPQLERYATRGQAQHGVDLVDLSGRDPLRAVQCKLHEEGKVTTASEVESEIEKAKTFRPHLGRYVIMTTGKVRKDVHNLLLRVNQQHRVDGLFTVEVLGWNRIEELLDEYTGIRDSYEGGLSAISAHRIESKLDRLSASIDQDSGARRGEDIQDRFHDKIDEARQYIVKHDYQIAKLLLQRIRMRSWDELSDRQRFRVLTNLAVIESSTDNLEDAAHLCLEAKNYQPTDEIARSNEAFACLLLGKRDQAFKLADELRKEFPNSPRVLEAFIRSAPPSMSLRSLLALVPEDRLNKEEIAVALADRALDAQEIDDAERLVRIVTDRGSPSPVPWLLLGYIVFQSEAAKTQRSYRTEGSPCDPVRLREAEDAFGKAFTRADQEHSTSKKVEALLNRSRTRLLLGDNVAAQEDMEEARTISPRNIEVIEAYGELLGLEGKNDDAIALMARVPQEKLSDHGRLVLGMLLIDRENPGDHRIAEGLLFSIGTSETAFPEGFREYSIELGFQAVASQDRFDSGHKLLEEVPAGRVTGVGLKSLKARLYALQGQHGEASQYVDEALAIIDHDTTVFDVRRIATVLMRLGRFAEALPLWQEISVPGVQDEDTRHLLECASRMNRHEVMLDTFRRLREQGQMDRALIDSELSLLQAYDIEKAIEVLNVELQKCPDDKELNLRRSLLGLALDRTDLVDPDPSAIPTPQDVDLDTASDAVHVLRETGHEQYAVEYAYELLRHNFHDPRGHRAYILALSPFRSQPDLEHPDRVESGVAVCYMEKEDSVPHWIIVEDVPDDTSQFPESELSPDHDISKAMMGKKVGDIFLLAKGIANRNSTITRIQNKYIYRYQDCMLQWQVRFPELSDVQAVRIPDRVVDTGDIEPDFSVIFKSLDERHDHVQNIEAIYEKDLLPLHVFGKSLGKNTFESLQHLSLSSDMPVKCCIGSSGEREQAENAFRSCNTIVIDMTGIVSLFLLDRLELLECPIVEYIVSQGTMTEIRQMVSNKSIFHNKESGVMAKTKAGYVLVDNTEGGHESYITSLRNIVDILETNCKIKSCRELAGMDPDKREKIVKLFGQYGAESILLSMAPGTILWTDDQTQAIVGRNEYGVSRVWTQIIVQKCVESGMVDPELFLDASAKLIGYGHQFTSQNPQTIRQAGIIAEWNVGVWPFSEVLSTLSSEHVELEQILQLVAGFLRLLYEEPILPQTRTSVTVAILERLSKRKGGIQGIRNLERALPQVFGLNVVGLMEAVENIKMWLRGMEGRPIIV